MIGYLILFGFLLTWSTLSYSLSFEDCKSASPIICDSSVFGREKIAVCLEKTKRGRTLYRTECVKSQWQIRKDVSISKCGCCVEETERKKTPDYCAIASMPSSSPSAISTEQPSEIRQTESQAPILTPTGSPVDSPLSLKDCESSNPLICGSNNNIAVCLAKNFTKM